MIHFLLVLFFKHNMKWGEPFQFGYYDYQQGRCDRCGGGSLAKEHQKPVDQMARIADALERIANTMEGWSGGEQGQFLDVRVYS